MIADSGNGAGTGNPNPNAGGNDVPQDPQKGSGGTSNHPSGGGGTGETYLTEAEAQQLADKRVNEALKTREQKIRDELAREYGDVKEKVESLQKLLDDEKAQREAAETKSEFIRGATANGVIDPDGAFAIVVANQDTYTKRNGDVDWDKLKEDKPYLFQMGATSTNSGQGKGRPPAGGTRTPSQEMTARIRELAGFGDNQ